MNATPILLLASLLASCAGPAVWRSPNYGPAQPVPALAAAAVYEFTVPEEKEQAVEVPEGVSLGDLARGALEYAKDNPEKIAEAAARGVLAKQALDAANAAVKAAAPGLHTKAMDYLKGQGFTIEVDAIRSAKLVGDGTIGGEFAYTAPGTAPRPFSTFPMFGPGSKASVAERLKTTRPREAYASVQATFQAADNQITNAVTCNLQIVVLDQGGEQVFGAAAAGTAPASGNGAKNVAAAFDAALAQMQQPATK